MKTNQLFTIFCTLAIMSSCTKSKLECQAETIPDCFSTLEYQPVCGCDGVTYGNSSAAACNSITETTEGECPILETWKFLGFKSDGSSIGEEKQYYSGTVMTLTIQEDADNDLLFPFLGTGQPNRFDGKYNINGSAFDIQSITEAKGSEIEDRFVASLPRVISSKRVGDYLVMDFMDDIGDQMIFIKK